MMNFLTSLFKEQSEKMSEFYKKLGAYGLGDEFKSVLDPLEQKLAAANVNIDQETVAPLLIVVRLREIDCIEKLSIKGKQIRIYRPPMSTMVSADTRERLIGGGVYIALGIKISPVPPDVVCRDQHLHLIETEGKHGVTADEAASLFFFYPEIFEKIMEEGTKVVLPGAYWYSNLVFGGMVQGLGIYCQRNKSISAGGAFMDATQPAIEVCEYMDRSSFSLMEATCDSRLFSE